MGFFPPAGAGLGTVDYEARWLDGQGREAAWRRFGITDEPGAYMGTRPQANPGNQTL